MNALNASSSAMGQKFNFYRFASFHGSAPAAVVVGAGALAHRPLSGFAWLAICGQLGMESKNHKGTQSGLWHFLCRAGGPVREKSCKFQKTSFEIPSAFFRRRPMALKIKITTEWLDWKDGILDFSTFFANGLPTRWCGVLSRSGCHAFWFPLFELIDFWGT